MSLTGRHLAPLWIAAVLASASVPIHQATALGVGEIEPASWLGSPFEALIPVTHVEAQNSAELAEQLKVTIGSPEDYERLGVEPSLMHRRLQIEPLVRDGRAWVRVSTREPLVEPYLDFVLTLRWPQGRLARGFTVLLDPPPSLPAAVAIEPPPPRSTAAADGRPTPSTEPLATTAVPGERLHAGQSYRTRPGDTLWNIAQRWAPEGNLDAAMQAIVAANRGAFIGGDPSRLMAGVSLRFPAAAPLAATASKAAERRDEEEVAPVVAAVTAVADAKAEPSAESAARLQLVSFREEGRADALQPVELGAEGRSILTRVDSLNDGVSSLSARLGDSRARLERLDVQLQGLLAAYDRQRNAGAPSAMPASATALSAIGTGAVPTARGSGQLTAAPAISSARESGWLAHFGYWLAIAGLGGWVAVQQWRLRRGRPAVAIDGVQAQQAARITASAAMARPVHGERAAPAAREAAEDMLARGLAPAKTKTQSTPPPGPGGVPLSSIADESVDPGISASVFLAFNRLHEAEQVLVEALELEPGRSDLQLQLLDLYLQTENSDAFERLAEVMVRQYADDEGVLDELAILREAHDASRA